VRLGAFDSETGAAIANRAMGWKTLRSMQPLYVMKLTKACIDMGCTDIKFYEQMMNQAMANIHFSSPELRLKLLQTFESAPGVADNSQLRVLKGRVQKLNGAGRISSR
ncbi:hypothetical protein DUNSADRAFT_11250, partial [Dunaliella salina]